VAGKGDVAAGLVTVSPEHRRIAAFTPAVIVSCVASISRYYLAYRLGAAGARR
jgi:hypothetical protein